MNFNVDWRTVRFGDVIRNINIAFDPATETALPYVAGTHIDDQVVAIRRSGLTSDPDFPPTFRRRFEPADVLFHSRNIAKVGTVEFAGVTGQKLFVLRSKDESIIGQGFLPWLMLSPGMLSYCEQRLSGSVNKFLNWKPLSDADISLPPIEEQERIAGLLWAAEDVALKAEAAVEAAWTVEKRVLEDAYVDPNWPVVRVKEAGQVQLGRMQHPKYQTGRCSRPYLKVANVHDDKLEIDDVPEMDFDDKHYAKYSLQPGDVLLNEGQSTELVGRCAMYQGEIEGCCYQKSLLRFRTGEGVLDEFAYGWFRRTYYRGDFARNSTKTTSLANLTAVRFSEMDFPVPELDVQNEVVRRVAEARAARRALEEHARASRRLVRGLIDRIFSEDVPPDELQRGQQRS